MIFYIIRCIILWKCIEDQSFDDISVLRTISRQNISDTLLIKKIDKVDILYNTTSWNTDGETSPVENVYSSTLDAMDNNIASNSPDHYHEEYHVDIAVH